MNENNLDDFTELLLAFIETIRPVVWRAAEHNLITPIEQAELDVIHEELLAWVIKVLA